MITLIHTPNNDTLIFRTQDERDLMMGVLQGDPFGELLPPPALLQIASNLKVDLAICLQSPAVNVVSHRVFHLLLKALTYLDRSGQKEDVGVLKEIFAVLGWSVSIAQGQTQVHAIDAPRSGVCFTNTDYVPPVEDGAPPWTIITAEALSSLRLYTELAQRQQEAGK
jgi:hypothetical protein